MKKCFILTVIPILYALQIQAQKIDSKFSVEFSMGASIPTGKFADKSYGSNVFLDNQPSGLAKTGLGLNLSLGYRISKSIGIMVLLGGSQNKQAASSFQDYLKNEYGNNIKTAIVTNSWLIGKILAGGFINLPLSTDGKLMLQPKLLAGICKTTTPQYSYAAVDENGNMLSDNLTKSKEHPGWAFCYQAGTTLKYRVSTKMYFLFDLNYFNGVPGIKYSYNPNFPSPGASVQAQRKYHVAAVNALLGIGINF